MNSSTRSMIAMILVSVILLVGCASPEVPASVPTKPAETTTESPTLTPTKTQTPAASTPESTRTPQPTDQPIGLNNLSEYPILVHDNLAEMVFLEIHTIDPEGSELNFNLFDWSNDGTLLLICVFDSNSGSSYQVYDLVEGSKLSEVEIDENVCDRAGLSKNWLEFSRDGKTFLGVMRSIYDIGVKGDSQIGIFKSTTGEKISELEGLSKLPEEIFSMYGASFSSQGTRLAISVYSHGIPASTQDASVAGGAWIDAASLIELYDVESGEHWGSFYKHKFLDAVDLEYSTEGEYLVFGVGDFAQAWSVDGVMTYEVECLFPDITFSPTSEVAALTCGYSEENFYHLLWDLKTGHSFRIEKVPGTYIRGLRYSQDGSLLIGLSYEDEISIWDGKNGEYLYTMLETYPTALDAHFIGGGRLVAVLFEGGYLQIFGVLSN